VNVSNIVIEQRLRTRGITATLAGVVAVDVAIGVLAILVTHHEPARVTIALVVAVAALPLFLATMVCSQVVVRVVDNDVGRSFEVLYGPRGMIRQVFGPDQITGASTSTMSFPSMGGWGYRGSLRLMRRAAVVTRRGEAVVLELVGDRRFLVTVDEPDSFVAAIAPSPA